MDWRDWIEQKPGVMVGKPVFKGTRLTVEHVLIELGHGMKRDELLRNHEGLTEEHIAAAMQFAADLIAKSSRAQRPVEPSAA